MQYLLIPALILSLTYVQAQETLRIGEWRSYLAYSAGVAVTQDEEKVYYGTENGLLSIRKNNLEVELFSKVDGLSDAGIRILKYHTGVNALIIVYTNSNIDFVFEDRILNVENILLNNTIIGSKLINHVYTDDSPVIYFSCDFGLVQFNLETFKFGFTMFTPTSVHGYTELRDTAYVATGNGIFRFDDFQTQEPANFLAWEQLDEETGLPPGQGEGVIVFNDQLMAAVDGGLYALTDGEFLLWDMQAGQYINFLSSDGEHLIAGFRCPENTCNGSIAFYAESGKLAGGGFGCVGRPTYAIEDETGAVWYANEFPGIRYSSNYQWGCELIELNTPYSNRSSEIAIKDHVVYVAAGGVSDRYDYLRSPDGFAIYSDGIWTWHNRTNHDQLQAIDPLDYFRILPHPDSNFIYIGTYYSGLLRYHPDTDTFDYYDQDNSALQGTIGDPLRERVAGMAFDNDGNLWLSNFFTERPVVLLKADGTWVNYAVPSSNELGQVVIDQQGYKWFAVISSSQGVLVFDDRGTLDDTSDDRYQFFNSTNSELPTNSLTTLTVDLDGDIWVGTAQGPVVFDGASDPFGDGPHGFRVKVDQEGIIAYLLAEEEITTIAVDGANRKWFGTHNGIFVQSPDGEEQIAVYNADNSPLLDNDITDIAINTENGEVFIGTQSGLISMRSEAVAGGRVHSSNVYAYPNPVRPGYEGPIAIRGLARDAAVKITDISGKLVYETRALGGQAIWHGKDFKGRRAQSGVYLVFSTTEPQFEKPDAIVTKILLIH